MIHSTSYFGEDLTMLTRLAREVQPQRIVEIGAQQGASAVALSQALQGGEIFVIDLFEEHYRIPPCKPTGADEAAVRQHLAEANPDPAKAHWHVWKGDGLEAASWLASVDLLHVDISNHYDVIWPLLRAWLHIVRSRILLEGGTINHWMKTDGFRCISEMLDDDWLRNWTHRQVSRTNGYVLTVLDRIA